MSKSSVLLLAAILALAVWSSVSSPAIAETAVGDDSDRLVSSLDSIVQSFDREGCESDCRTRFGFQLYHRGSGPGSEGYYAFAECMQKCNKTFWKEFDRDIDSLKKE
jgi:hypothetical protein